MMRLAGFSIAILLCCVSVGTALGQVVVDLEFDKYKAKYLSGYSFGGYGPSDGSDAESLDDMLSNEVSEDSSNGRPASLGLLEAQLEDAKEDGDKLKKIQLKIDALKKSPNACAKVQFDTSAMEVPSDATFDYVGVGLGVTFDLTDVKLPSLKAADYQIMFDAKVVGTEPLNQSKLSINFVKEDGDDEDDFEDVVVQLIRGEDDGTDAFTITSEYQTFTIGLGTMVERKGQMSDLSDAKLTGVTFNVQAQGNAADFAADKDNVLYVDNIKLIKQ